MTEDEEHDIDLIEGYHKGTLTADELRSLKDRMAADPSFAQKVEDFRDIFIGIKAHGEKNFSAEVNSWEKEIRDEEGKETKTISFNPRIWKIAAAIVAVVATAAIVFWPSQKPSNNQLFTYYFVPYENILAVRGEDDKQLQQAMDAYTHSAFPEAAKLLKEYLATKPNDLVVLFYYGVSEIGANNASVGMEALGRVESENGVLKEQAQWFSALGLLKDGKIDDCKAALSAINVDGHDYQQQAQKLLEQL
jgi:hypothetical protein